MAQRTSRAQWVQAAFEAMASGGVDAIRVEPLARSLGVTKGSFYHHFDNRRSLHVAVLEAWEQLGTAGIIDVVEATDATPAQRLRLLIERTYAVDDFADNVETAIRAWASTDDVAAEAVARVDEDRVGYVTALLAGAGHDRTLAKLRARLMYRHLIGEFTWRTSGGPTSSKRERDELAALLLP